MAIFMGYRDLFAICVLVLLSGIRNTHQDESSAIYCGLFGGEIRRRSLGI